MTTPIEKPDIAAIVSYNDEGQTGLYASELEEVETQTLSGFRDSNSELSSKIWQQNAVQQTLLSSGATESEL
jgi:hypothetical protein